MSVCAENRVFEIKGTEKLLAGLYLENRYPAIIFQKIGGNDAHGNFNFLFITSKILLKWRMGYGKSGRAIIVTHVAKSPKSGLLFRVDRKVHIVDPPLLTRASLA